MSEDRFTRTSATLTALEGGDGNDNIDGSHLAETILGGAGQDNLNGGFDSDTLEGGSGNDTLDGDSGDDLLSGGSGTDSVQGDQGNDTLTGGSGNDLLNGGHGDDLYRYGRGDGFDRITEISSGSGTDVLHLTDGLTLADIRLVGNSDDLFVVLTDGTGEVRIQDQFDFLDARIESLVFDDGTTIDLTGPLALQGGDGDDFIDSANLGDTLSGGAGNDDLDGLAGDDVQFGGSGTDRLKGDGGNDSLDGGSGNDTLTGSRGDDTIQGGSGNDSLQGGFGNDAYVYDRGDGFDTISERSPVGGGFDVLVLGAGITTDDVILQSNGADLFVQLRDGTGQITIDDQLTNADAQVERLIFADGTEIDLTTSIRQTGNDANNALNGSHFGETISGGNGDDDLEGRDGQDVLLGESGDDSLEGGSGADSLFGGIGRDTLDGDEGNDTLDGGTGEDQLGGHEGDDTYLFVRGSFLTIVENRLGTGSGFDTIELEAGISLADIRLSADAFGDLFINIQEGTGRIRVDEQFNRVASRVELLRLADGTEVDLTAGLGLDGDGASDTMFGSDFDDTMSGEGGSDLLSGRSGADRISGGGGGDNLSGGTGADTLEGGTGNDALNGGLGNDTFVYRRGDGTDHIFESAGIETLAFGAGISVSDLVLSQAGNDLILTLDDGSGSIRLDNQFLSSGSSQVEFARFADGSTLNLVDGITPVDQNLTGSDAAENLSGGSGDDTIDGEAGADRLTGLGGRDVLRGGVANDTLFGGADDDLYLHDAGDGSDVIDERGGDGHDILQLGAGIAPSDVRFVAGGDNLFVVINGVPGSGFIEIVNQQGQRFGDEFNRDSQIEVLRFDDGTEVDLTAPLLYQGGAANDVMDGALQNDTLLGLAGNDSLAGRFGADLLQGGAGNDTLQGEADDDLLIGGEGTDSLFGGDDDDTLAGGIGNDLLRGDAGDDVFVFARGDGSDRILESSSDAGIDVIEFGADIAVSDIRLSYLVSQNFLAVSLRDGSGGITIDGQFNGLAGVDIELLRFADGTNIDLTGPLLMEGTDGNDLLDSDRLGDTVLGGGGNDDLDGFGGDDRLEGEGGNDTLEGGSGADTLSGGDGFDSLRGNSGDDRLIGGSGNDTLDGDEGNDTYVYARGDGFDVIAETQANSGTDVIELAAGIALADIRLAIIATDDLLIRLVDGTGEIRITDQFGASIDRRIETLRFADGTELDLTGPLLTRGSDGGDQLDSSRFGDTVLGGDGNDDLDGFGGDDRLEGESGSDNLDGDSGDDSLIGGFGNDTLFGNADADDLDGGRGNDSLRGGFGDDTYHYARGDGFDTINENDSFSGGNDRILLAAGIGADDVRLSGDSNNLFILMTDGTGGITIQGQTTRVDARIETLEFDDGTVIDLTAPLVLQGGDGDDVITSGFRDDTVAGGPGADRLRGGDGDDVLQGDSGNDSLFGGGDDDLLEGGSGNDSLEGSSGDDTLRGDQGNDLLDGEFGDDLFIYGRGDGFDTIAETSTFAGGQDTLSLVDGIAPGEVRLLLNGTTLTVSLTDGTGAVALQNQTDTATRIEELHFDDGTVIDLTGPLVLQGGDGGDRMTSEILADTLLGGDGNDTIFGLGDDRLFGGSGNDTIDANAGDDLLDGGIGNDTLFGDAGDDTLIAGAGNDTLSGGAGDDIYRFGSGDGADIINENLSSTGSGFDVIELGAGLDASDIRFTSLAVSGRDLIITIIASGESITIDEQFSRLDNQVEVLRLADGFEFDLTGGIDLVGDGGSNTLRGSEQSDTLSAAAGNDIAAGEGGNDLILGQGGNDTLSGGTGSDTLDGGIGDDSLNGGEDDDTYLYARGDGTVRITETAGTDRIVFAPGIAAGEVTVSQVGNELILGLSDGSGAITVQSHFAFPSHQVEAMQFADGTLVSLVDGIAPVGQVFNGTDSVDFLTGTSGNDSMFGGDGADRLVAGIGDDLLDGDAGNDTLQGDEGNDTYVYRPGDGFDTVDERSGGGFDVLSLQGGLLADDVRFVSGTRDLVVVLEDGSGSITLNDHFQNGSGNEFDAAGRVEVLRFSDGSEVSLTGTLTLEGGAGNDVISSFILGDTVLGEGGNDRLNGLGGDDVMDGGTGNDSLGGDDGDDNLSGGSGADSLLGDDGDDTLVGGTGDDTLVGGVGDDLYIYASGDGNDLIDESSFQKSGTDTLQLDAGIAVSDIDLRIGSSGNDLFVVMRDGSGEIRIDDQFSDAVGAVEFLQFADGTVIDLTAPLLSRGSDGNDALNSSDLGDTVLGDGGNDFLNGFDGDDALAGDGGNDTLRGGLGADSLTGGGGADNLDGDSGDDDLTGGAGNDILQGGFGDDRFIYARGDGFDVIDEASAANGFDVIDLGAGISQADVRLTVTNSDLFITLTDGSGQIRIDDQFGAETAHVELLRFADGSVISLDGVVGAAVENSPPQAVDDAFSLSEDTDLLMEVLANDLDGDGDELTLLTATDGANGSTVIEGDRIRYTPDADFNGSDSFTYTISDGDPQRTATATVLVTVQPVNDAPVTVADFATIDEDASAIFDVLANDFDVDGDDLSVISVVPGTGSVNILADGRLGYVAAPDQTGPDGVEYLVSDGNGGITSGALTVTLTPVNDAPLANDDVATVDEDTSVIIDVLANDQDFDNVDFGNGGLSVVAATAGDGAVVIGADGRLTYTPDADFNGADSISYTISDSAGATDSASVAVTVNPVNDAPTAVTLDSDTVREDAGNGDLVARLTGIDPDGDDLTFTLLQNADGRFALDGDRLVVAADDVLDRDIAAQHVIQVEGRDPGGLTMQQSLTINVLDVLDGGSLDLDGNGNSDALTDGLIALGHAFGAPVSQLADLAASGSPGRDTATLAATLAEAEATFLDVDGNGDVDALTDGLMILGFLFGAPASQLVPFADPAGDRTTAQSINDFLESFDVAA